jgi:precorrin-6B methylase 1
VCVAVHGRSALNVELSRAAIAQGRAEGFSATIVPGVSTLDCLFADLGLDLVRSGCQIFGAKAFLARRQRPKLSVGLILSLDEEAAPGELLEALRSAYGVEHKAVLYEPARYAVLEPVIRHCAIGDIGEADLAEVSIVYIPAKDAEVRAGADQRYRKRTK